MRAIRVGKGWFPWCVLVAASLALTGCAQMRDMLNLETPKARVTAVSLGDASLEAATLFFDVEIENPYRVPLPLANADYSLASAGRAFLSGKAALQGTVPARSKQIVRLPARMVYAEVLKSLSGVRPGSVVPYDAEMGLSVDVPGAGPLRLPLRKAGKLPVPTAPDVEVREIRWSSVALDKAAGQVTLAVVNRNQFPVDLSTFAYALSLGGVGVAESSLAKAVRFEADGGAGTVEIPISFAPQNFGLAVVQMLAGKGSGYSLKGAMDVNTPFGPMSLPVGKTGNTVFRK